jgi:hypothetical protein
MTGTVRWVEARNIVFDQLAHASIARAIRGPAEHHRDDVFLVTAHR